MYSNKALFNVSLGTLACNINVYGSNGPKANINTCVSDRKPSSIVPATPGSICSSTFYIRFMRAEEMQDRGHGMNVGNLEKLEETCKL